MVLTNFNDGLIPVGILMDSDLAYDHQSLGLVVVVECNLNDDLISEKLDQLKVTFDI